MNLDNIFTRPNVVRAFARAETLLGGQSFKLDDGRTLTGVINRLRNGRTMLATGFEIQADFMVVATRAQFGDKPPVTDQGVECSGLQCRISSGVESDEVHHTFYCAKVN